MFAKVIAIACGRHIYTTLFVHPLTIPSWDPLRSHEFRWRLRFFNRHWRVGRCWGTPNLVPLYLWWPSADSWQWCEEIPVSNGSISYGSKLGTWIIGWKNANYNTTNIWSLSLGLTFDTGPMESLTYLFNLHQSTRFPHPRYKGGKLVKSI